MFKRKIIYNERGERMVLKTRLENVLPYRIEKNKRQLKKGLTDDSGTKRQICVDHPNWLAAAQTNDFTEMVKYETDKYKKMLKREADRREKLGRRN